MRKKITTVLAIICLSIVILLGMASTIWASENTESHTTLDSEVVPDKLIPYRSQNEETGYYIYVEDWAGLLTPSEKEKLIKLMEPITAYGNVAFVSISSNPTYSTERYAESYYEENFGYSSGTVLIIDMDERYIWIHSNGEIYRTITDAYANTITDNCYSYASDEDYYRCAATAFEQINTLLEGRAIAQPMKYISNAFLAIIIALLINYFIVMFISRGRKPSTSQLLNGIFSKVDVKNPRTQFINQTRRYSPQSRSSSGGGRSGGGGSRGGGGGHRF